MSIEKYNPKVEYETIPYAQININVIQNIPNMEAGFVWVYLQTKPKDWKIIKEHLKNHFKIGDGKIKKIFSYLAKSQLIEYIKEYDSKGKITGWDIKVLNGSRFVSYPQPESTGSIIHRVDSHSNGSGALHIIENTNNRKSRELVRKKREALSENFEANQEALVAMKSKNLDPMKVISKFRQDAKSKDLRYVDWDAAFMKWIINEKVVSNALIFSKNVINSPINEPRCTVPDYGPGHPTWEALHGNSVSK